MVQTEYHACEICDSSDSIAISSKGRDYIKTYTAICKNCGFVHLNPRLNPESYADFYVHTYDKLYRSNNFGVEILDEEIEKNPYSFYPVYQRLINGAKIPVNPSILEIGCGDGSNLLYLGRKFNARKLMGIEPSKKGQQFINAKGIELIAEDINDNWRVNEGVDLIILRHVLEHLPDLNGSLGKIHTVMSNDSLLYIAVPNMYNIGKMSLLRDFFRIVHLSYFTVNSLSNLLHRNKFEIVEIVEHTSTNSEIYLIARKAEIKGPMNVDNNEYRKQLDYINPFIQNESTLPARFSALRAYINRRYVILKSSILHR